MTRLLLDTHRAGDVSVVVFAGEIDMATATNLAAAASAALAQADVGSVRLDLSQVSFLDSSGLGALVEIHRAATTLAKTVVLFNPQPAPLRLLELTAVRHLVVIEPMGHL